MAYKCHTCGELHHDLPDVGTNKPAYWWSVPEQEHEQRITLTADTCIIDDDYFIRGVIEIPIHDSSQHFGFGVWVSQSHQNFLVYQNNPDTSEIGPFLGWLSTEVQYYLVSSLNLKAKAHFQGSGLRPLIELEPTEHPLAVDQRNGITLQKAWKIVHFYSDTHK